MDGNDVRMVAVCCREFLAAAPGADFTAVSPTIGAPVRDVVGHIATTLLWYATDLASGPEDLATMHLSMREDARPADLVRSLEAFAGVLAATVDASPPGQRGWHDWGRPDSSGMAAMGCDEMLVHTYDAALGLGLAFTPPPAPVERTLQRLFPWAPTDTEPWATLLWANGRADLPGRARQSGWRWFCSPLKEWDGRDPALANLGG